MKSINKTAWDSFLELKPENNFEGKGFPCGSEKQHLLVKGQDSEPILFLKSEARVRPRAPFRLKNVIGEFDSKYILETKNSTELVHSSFTTFRCVPEAAELHPYFVEMMVATAATQPAILNQEQVDKIVASLLEIFRQGDLASQSTVTGLWGELLLIYSAAEPNEWVGAWHETPTENFDFSFSNKRIEVKATEKQLREHEFSLTQLSPSLNTDYVASVLLRRSAAGCTIIELAKKIANKLNADSRVKFWGLVFRTLGEESISLGDARYDLECAKNSIKFVKSSNIPRPTLCEEAIRVVSHIRFRANIESIVRDFGFSSLP